MKLNLSGANSCHVLKQGGKIKVRLNETSNKPQRIEEGVLLTADGTGILLLQVTQANFYSEEKTEVFIPWTSISEVFPEQKPIGFFVKEIDNLCRLIKLNVDEYREWKTKFEEKTQTPGFENLKIANSFTGEAKPYKEWLREKEKEIYNQVLEQRNIISKHNRRNMSVGDRARLLILLQPQAGLVSGMHETSILTQSLIRALTESTIINYPPWHHPDGTVEYSDEEIKQMGQQGDINDDDVPF